MTTDSQPPVPAPEARRDELVMQFAATTTRLPGESDEELQNRVERSAYALIQHAPFSGFEGVQFYPGAIRFDGSPEARRWGGVMGMGERRDVCHWSYMDWPMSDSDFEGDCGVAWSMNVGGLAENGMQFCPRCGGRIEFIAPEPEPEDDDA